MAQRWSGLELVRNTTAPIASPMLRAQGKPACLSTDGGSLFIEECLEDPPHCLVRAPDCPVSGAIATTSRFAVLSVSLTQNAS